VPAFVRWPSKIGSVVNGIVTHQDWLATFLAAAGEQDCPSSEFLRQRAVPIRGGSGSFYLMTLRGLPLVLQAALGDGLAFDPFSLQQDCLAASEVDVGRGRLILQPIALIGRLR
jgi:hypothetical protein